jgi:hypothetical protein
MYTFLMIDSTGREQLSSQRFETIKYAAMAASSYLEVMAENGDFVTVQIIDVSRHVQA